MADMAIKVDSSKSWGIYAPLVIKNASTPYRVSTAQLRIVQKKTPRVCRSLQLFQSQSWVSLVALLLLRSSKRPTPVALTSLTRGINKAAATGHT